MKFIPHDYQAYCIRQIEERPRVALFLDPGLGKTVITLTAISDMIGIDVSKVLVIAPLRVAEATWEQEAQKWDHLSGLRFSRILGGKKDRIEGLKQDADIYLMNRENTVWLVDHLQGEEWPFDMVVIDELSSFKSSQAERWRALRRVSPIIQRVVGLTGTPAPNSLIDLWAQMYLIDRGESLGRFIGRYRDAFFTPGMRNGNVVYQYILKKGADKLIYDRIKPYTVSMRAQDHITMPERIDNIIEVDMPEEAWKTYRQMENELVAGLDDTEITASTAATVGLKLLQMADGAVYDDDKRWHTVHTAKLDALADLIEAANGNPILCFYSFKFDKQFILTRFPEAVSLEGQKQIDDWNAGKIPLLLAHPDSAGYGLNLQAGGHIMVWYGLTWSLEKYIQACDRLHRQGQTEAVVIHHIVAKGTIDERVMAALKRKDKGQNALLDALKATIKAVERRGPEPEPEPPKDERRFFHDPQTDEYWMIKPGMLMIPGTEKYEISREEYVAILNRKSRELKERYEKEDQQGKPQEH